MICFWLSPTHSRLPNEKGSPCSVSGLATSCVNKGEISPNSILVGVFSGATNMYPDGDNRRRMGPCMCKGPEASERQRAGHSYASSIV